MLGMSDGNRPFKYARPELAEDLRRLGLAPGTIVMVHASVRAVGPTHGGPDEIHLAIVDAIAPGGTIAMVASCQEGFDDVGRGIYSPEQEAEIIARQPAFDPQTARADREIGALAEFFRSYPGTICSDHVTGRISARGERARWLTADQPWTYFFGRGSPLEKLCAARGKVLLLGADHDTVTLLHYAEHVADFPDKRVARFQVPVLQDGKRVWRSCEEYDTSERGGHAAWPERFFAIIVDDFIAGHAGSALCAQGNVGDAECFLLDAAGLVDHAIPMMIARANGMSPAV